MSGIIIQIDVIVSVLREADNRMILRKAFRAVQHISVIPVDNSISVLAADDLVSTDIFRCKLPDVGTGLHTKELVVDGVKDPAGIVIALCQIVNISVVDRHRIRRGILRIGISAKRVGERLRCLLVHDRGKLPQLLGFVQICPDRFCLHESGIIRAYRRRIRAVSGVVHDPLQGTVVPKGIIHGAFRHVSCRCVSLFIKMIELMLHFRPGGT